MYLFFLFLYVKVKKKVETCVNYEKYILKNGGCRRPPQQFVLTGGWLVVEGGWLAVTNAHCLAISGGCIEQELKFSSTAHVLRQL